MIQEGQEQNTLKKKLNCMKENKKVLLFLKNTLKIILSIQDMGITQLSKKQNVLIMKYAYLKDKALLTQVVKSTILFMMAKQKRKDHQKIHIIYLLHMNSYNNIIQEIQTYKTQKEQFQALQEIKLLKIKNKLKNQYKKVLTSISTFVYLMITIKQNLNRFNLLIRYVTFLLILIKDKSEIQQLQELQKNPYEKYLDALDKFKNEMNQGQSGEFKDRHHFIVNPDNPYAPVEHPRYNNQGNQNKENSDKNGVQYEKALDKESNLDRQQYKPENNRKYHQEDESYKPRQFRDESKLQNYNSQLEIKEQQFKSQEQNQDYYKQLEYERIIEEYEKQKKLDEYKAEQQNLQKEREYQYEKNNEISLLKNEKRSISPYQREQQGIRQSGRQSPEIDYRRQGLQSQYKSQPNLSKLNHQQEIISHAINNISPQITKQNLAPNLNLEGYIQYGKGARLNPTSMSYVGTELANKNITLTHNLLGNQIIAKEKNLRANQKDNLRYTHTQLNFQKFEKYPGEFMDILKSQGKAPTNENLFQLQYERANAPKSTMDTLIKYPVNVYEKGEGNLDHYKRETVALPQQRDIPSDYQQPLKNNSVLQQRQNEDSVGYKQFKNNTPFGAPFSYNPNEYKKKEMVALNHSKQLEKIEQMMDKADKQIDNIQRSSPDIQQPHIKKTLNPEHYAEIINQIRAEEEEKARNKMEYQRYLEQKHQQESFAGLGSYGDVQRQKDQKSNQSMEYIQQYGAKGLRNLSNVRIF